jgi:hypothetical protein
LTLDDFISKNPTREEIALQICAVANNNVLEIEETFVWETLSELGSFTKNDFFDDVQETFDRYGSEALTHYGIVNWKLKKKSNECVFCENDYPTVWEDTDGKKVCEVCYERESDTGEVY